MTWCFEVSTHSTWDGPRHSLLSLMLRQLTRLTKGIRATGNVAREEDVRARIIGEEPMRSETWISYGDARIAYDEIE